MNRPGLVMQAAYIALGSNLNNPQRQLQQGFAALLHLPHTQLVAQSSLYRSAPVGYADQPDFVNAVAAVTTGLAPRELLDALLAIERAQGRAREIPNVLNGPRTLDLDLVLYGERVLDEPGLTVPHPRMAQRAFVIVPLAEIAPGAVVPGLGCVSDLLRGVNAGDLVMLNPVAA